MEFRLPPIYITDLKTFEPEKWRAVHLTKERRTKGDFYFGLLVRNYGTDDVSETYDVGDTNEDYVWIGRHEIAVGKSSWSKDPEKPGTRIREDAEWETEQDPVTKKDIQILIKGKRIWKYTMPVTAENTKLLKSMVGTVDMNRATTFQIIKGSTNPISVEEDKFFTKPVVELMSNHMEIIQNIRVEKKLT